MISGTIDKSGENMEEEKVKEITMVGLRKSSSLMTIAIIAFIAMSMIMVTAVFEGFSNLVIVLISGALALTLIGTIFMIMRYFAEQQIIYSSMNTYMALEKKEE